ncbi:ATP-binding protein [Chitinophaga sp.]|uniref:ATP-binding protein n=1 Tax=Chitinophaga sp. TaxID=1869181 RepID=UPI0031DA0C79
MQPKHLKYYLLGVFISGMILFIVLQFNSSQNIRKLISGNEQLLNELNVKNELQKLQTSIARTDSKVRGTVISQDTLNITGIEADVALIKADLNEINKLVMSDSTEKLLTQLNYLVEEKNHFNVSVLDSFYTHGKWSAERLINAQKGKRLGDAIVVILRQLDSTRQTEVNRTVTLIDTSGQRAQNWGSVMMIFACASSLLAFLYITTRIHKQEQLIEALDKSQQQEKKLAAIKDQFLANMSHEIRTPMNAVLGFTHLLQQQPLNEKAREYVTAIENAGENLLEIINDILDISKIESGMMRLEPVSFSLRGVLHAVQTMFRLKAEEKNLAFNVAIDDNVPDILYGDVVRLTQVLVNLTNNAIKFTNQGHVNIMVNKFGENEHTVRVLFTVSDTGIGIAPDKLPAIFDRFNQAEADTTRKYGGTGLGLTIVKQLVEIQHGAITVESEPGKGSTFMVELPYSLGESLPENGETTSDNILSALHADVRLLVAEDNKMNQDLLKHLLGNRQMPYHLVTTGQDVLTALGKGHYDMILMDIQMPEMDGYTAARKIRQELHSNIPIIAMTAHAMAGEREKCLQAGMNEYLSKPIREEELFRLIQVFTGKVSPPDVHTHSNAVNGQSQPHEGPLVQLQYLKTLSKGDTEFEHAMLQQFVTQLPEDLGALKKAIQAEDIAAIKSTAHNLKTTISFIGLDGILYPILEPLESLDPNHYQPALVAEKFATLRELSLKAMEETMAILL